MKKRSFLLAAASALILSACSTTGPGDKGDPASKRASIDAAVDSALSSLYSQDPGARELAAKASGVLVFPSVVSAGFVVGGSYGQGALRVGGKTAGYYSTATGSVGLLAGAESDWNFASASVVMKRMYIAFAWLPAFLEYYNNRRAHSALGFRPPASRLSGNNLLTIKI